MKTIQPLPTEPLKVATVQFQHQNADKPANLAVIESFVKQAQQQQVNLIAFPECCISGYWGIRNYSKSDLHELSEPVPDGESCKALQKMAAQYQICIGAGLFEISEENKLFNTYVVSLPDGTIHSHRKLHAFVNPHLSCGDSYTVFEIQNGWKVGILICYDNNIIENARQTALLGADILLAPHQTGGTYSKSPYGLKPIDVSLWKKRHENPDALEQEILGPKGREWLIRWLPSRAHDNGMFYIFSNGVGQDDDEIRTGNAMILDPYGRIITETWDAEDKMLIAELNPQLLDNCTGRRWMSARRPELYEDLTKPTGQETDIFSARFGE